MNNNNINNNNNNNNNNVYNNNKLYPKDMRGLAIGGEEDCGMSTYTQWVGGGRGQERR